MDGPANAYDRAAESLGNVVEFQHVNLRIPDQQAATAFYISGLGLTRDPFLMTGTDNMWPMPAPASSTCRPARRRCCAARPASWCRTSAVARTAGARAPQLEGTRSASRRRRTAPRRPAPGATASAATRRTRRGSGRITLGIPYVEFDVPPGTIAGIARFYREIVGAPAWVEAAAASRVRWCQEPAPRVPRDRPPAPPFDGHHVQIALADFGGPYARLGERGLVSQEDSPWQYRFRDIVDLDTGAVLFTVEHEVRSMTPPDVRAAAGEPERGDQQPELRPRARGVGLGHAAALRRRRSVSRA